MLLQHAGLDRNFFCINLRLPKVVTWLQSLCHTIRPLPRDWTAPTVVASHWTVAASSAHLSQSAVAEVTAAAYWTAPTMSTSRRPRAAVMRQVLADMKDCDCVGAPTPRQLLQLLGGLSSPTLIDVSCTVTTRAGALTRGCCMCALPLRVKNKGFQVVGLRFRV